MKTSVFRFICFLLGISTITFAILGFIQFSLCINNSSEEIQNMAPYFIISAIIALLVTVFLITLDNFVLASSKIIGENDERIAALEREIEELKSKKDDE